MKAERIPFAEWWMVLEQDVLDPLIQIANQYEVTPGAMQSRTLKPQVCRAREAFWAIMRERGHSLVECGKMLQKHHTAVVRAMQRRSGAAARMLQTEREAATVEAERLVSQYPAGFVFTRLDLTSVITNAILSAADTLRACRGLEENDG